MTKSVLLLAGAAASLGLTSIARADAEAAAAKSSDEIRAIVAEMIADSETRSSLLQSGATGGHDGKNFFLASADGRFRLNVSGYLQFRYDLTFRDGEQGDPDADPPIAGSDEFEAGFQTARTKLIFDGHVFEPELFYRIQGAFDRRDPGNFSLEDAYVGYDWSNGFKSLWGQFKLPFLREELVSETYQLAVDHSFTNQAFTADRGQGLEGIWESENFRAAFAFSDGFNSDNTDIRSGNVGGDPADLSFTGRVEVLFGGSWRQFDDFTSPQGSDFAFMLGGAAAYEVGEDRGDATNEPKRFNWTVDGSVEGDGWNLFGMFTGNHVDGGNSRFTGDGNDLFDNASSNFGYVVQGGIYLGEPFELFGRWDHTLFDEDIPSTTASTDEFKTITAGFNYYIYSHAAKFTMDLQWFLDEAPQGFDSTLTNLTAPADKDQIAIRFQFQLMF